MSVAGRVLWRYRHHGDAYVTFGVDALGRPMKLAFVWMPAHYERSAQMPSDAADGG